MVNLPIVSAFIVSLMLFVRPNSIVQSLMPSMLYFVSSGSATITSPAESFYFAVILIPLKLLINISHHHHHHHHQHQVFHLLLLRTICQMILLFMRWTKTLRVVITAFVSNIILAVSIK